MEQQNKESRLETIDKIHDRCESVLTKLSEIEINEDTTFGTLKKILSVYTESYELLKDAYGIIMESMDEVELLMEMPCRIARNVKLRSLILDRLSDMKQQIA